MKFIPGQGWEYTPPSLCSIGGGSQQSSNQATQQSTQQGSGQSTQGSISGAANYQNPAFVNAAPGTMSELNAVGQNASIQGLSPFYAGGTPTNSGLNPLVAPVTGAQQNTLSQIGNTLGQTPGTLQGAFGALNAEMAPNFAQNLATSPQTMAAIQSALGPIRQQFNTQTVPGLEGSFTQAGQRIGSATGMGSSAFDNSFAAAQGNELANEAATAGGIANSAYQTGLNIQANAPAQVASLQSSELSDLISGLNAQALPQLTQQYGISAGTQLYQQQMNSILQALGLQVQGEQPTLGYNSLSAGQSTEQSSGQSSGQSTGQSSGSSFSLSNPFGSMLPS